MIIRTHEQLEEYLRDMGYFVTPPGGGWVTIHGNRGMVPRGLRILASHRAAGVRHLDIYWAVNERLAFPPRFPRGGFSVKTGDLDDIEVLIRDPISGSRQQATWMEIVSPYPATIRFYNGEVTSTSEELISNLLEENCLEVIRFGVDKADPIWEEATRDIMDSLRLDGLSYGEAQHELITLGLIKEEEQKIPHWFYRPIGWYYNQFCEEPEYEELVRRGYYTPPEIPEGAFS